MRAKPPPIPSRKPADKDAKAERLAAALRANLSRRKEQKRARAPESAEPPNRD